MGMPKLRVTGVVMMIIFAITSSSVAQEGAFECSARCYDPDLTLVKGDVMVWEFENFMIQDDDIDILVEPQVLSEVKITLLKSLNGLFDSIMANENEYLEVIASISFPEDNSIKKIRIHMARIPGSVFVPTMINIRSNLINMFEYLFTDNSEWEYDRTILNGTSITTNYYNGFVSVLNDIYIFSQTTRTESRIDENIFNIFTVHTEQWEVDTGILTSFNLTSWSEGSSPKTSLVRLVEFSPFEELGINLELLLSIFVGILIFTATFTLIYLYFHRRRR